MHQPIPPSSEAEDLDVQKAVQELGQLLETAKGCTLPLFHPVKEQWLDDLKDVGHRDVLLVLLPRGGLAKALVISPSR
ncbi:hypothetical protein LJU02_10575 [Corynebacterium pseudotuberculosis]|uniref:Uncharacterized protein n=1 Tax=Corynebacterium pseudotuberculosis 258 TaxID=1168865 RepID=A0AAU8PTV9_CORPS|nr:hypothetical protein [Corynebacterium pseudotuberculosis]AFB73403.1 hypothetical protein CP316_10660 [Corynebacterium pseudotuberculosis 316]AFK17703.1 hypothetical protein CP258_10675 [Corynebacterium pseudotuberculosis 258]AKS14414.1 Hypothetical protein CpE19_2080 [Corynebacterium pseudotuberculosis]AMN69100.1 hypothetical protein ATN02_00240 [Corynebacterium pseudotuberculosis]AMN72718.1 hypothetical protein ATN03_10480 [Corynebacterium pseudotuberculosis]